MKGFVKNSDGEVDAINYHRKYKAAEPAKEKKIVDCRNCGQDHAVNQCPVYGKMCNAYGWKNHFEKKCRHKQAGQAPAKVNAISGVSEDSVYDHLFMD